MWKILLITIILLLLLLTILLLLLLITTIIIKNSIAQARVDPNPIHPPPAKNLERASPY